MSIVPRPPKTGGNTTYLAEVADGNTHIKAAEVDDDFRTIYTNVNGLLDNSNIRDNADIATAKIAQDGGLQTGHLADGAVTSAKILDGTIMADDLAPDAVTTAKILNEAVTTDKIAIGGSVASYAGVPVVTGLNFSTVETTVVTIPITLRGYVPEIFGTWGLYAALTSAGTQFYSINMKRDGVTFSTVTVQVIGSAAGIRVPIPAPHIIDAFIIGTPGTYSYTITIQTSDASVAILSDGTNAGSFFARELA